MSAEEIAALTGRAVASVRVIGGQHGVRHLEVLFADDRATDDKATDGRTAFAKVGAGGFDAEANGLRWLAEADAVPVPPVLGVAENVLVIAMVDSTGPPGHADAYRFGSDLARLHLAGAASFGAPWPGNIASLPLDNTPGDSWPRWYAERRLLPFADHAPEVLAVIDRIEDLAGPAEPPARIHGDCWSGNVLWSGGRGWLIDPAAHGGHRETDLAMLALFGAPHLDAILAGYEAVAPLVPGWQARVPLHQLHPLLVHARLFGSSYRRAATAAARQLLQ